MNPYAPPVEGATPGIAKRGVRWPIRTRLKLFVGFAMTSLLLNFGLFHAPFVLFGNDLTPFGFEIAHRYLFTWVGVGVWMPVENWS